MIGFGSCDKMDRSIKVIQFSRKWKKGGGSGRFNLKTCIPSSTKIRWIICGKSLSGVYYGIITPKRG